MAVSGWDFHKADVWSTPILFRASPVDDEFMNSVGTDASSTKISDIVTTSEDVEIHPDANFL